MLRGCFTDRLFDPEEFPEGGGGSKGDGELHIPPGTPITDTPISGIAWATIWSRSRMAIPFRKMRFQLLDGMPRPGCAGLADGVLVAEKT